jgi:death-on-curing protein
VKYLSAEQVLFIHSRLIDTTGGAHGLRDTGLLRSAVARPRVTFKGKGLYPDIFHKAASLLESLIKNHPFVDGNKRTAITSASLFLQLNGCRLNTNQKELERFTLRMAVSKISFHEAVEWFKKNTSKE